MSGDASRTLFTMLEPHGHSAPASKLERFWDACPAGGGLERTRVDLLDAPSGMTYAPMQYVVREMQTFDPVPDSDWVPSAFLEFVRSEFSAQRKQKLLPFPTISDRLLLPPGFLGDFLSASEDLPLSLPKSAEVNGTEEVAGAIFELLCHANLGSNANRRHNKRADFISALAPTIERRGRLLFVLPGFPFKDQNRFRVPYEGDQPDLAEISFLIRLHRLTQALYQVHPYGADVLVLCDGHLYADIFGVAHDVVDRYHERILGYRNLLNLQGTVSFIDLADLFKRAPQMALARSLDEAIAAVEQTLRTLVGSPHGEVGEAFGSLVLGIRRNMESRKRLQHLDDQEAWDLMTLDPVLGDESAAPGGTAFLRDARQSALRYASVNLVLKWTRLIARYFPGAIRGTVHPKPGQFGLAGAGAYAWNGVGWSNGVPEIIDHVSVRPFVSLSDVQDIVEVCFDSGQPACFIRGDR